jgi:hypothetical protein
MRAQKKRKNQKLEMKEEEEEEEKKIEEEDELEKRDGKEFQLNRICRWKKEEEVGRKNQKEKLEKKKTKGRKRKKRVELMGKREMFYIIFMAREVVKYKMLYTY